MTSKAVLLFLGYTLSVGSVGQVYLQNELQDAVAKSVFQELDHEELWVLYLNLGNKPISFVKLTTGGWDSTIIDIRQIHLEEIGLSVIPDVDEFEIIKGS